MVKKSDMNFYKINDQDFVVSVKVEIDGPIRYYRLTLKDDGTSDIYRIKNALSFLNSRETLKVTEFTPDYIKIVTSLVGVCDFDIQDVEVSRKSKKAYDYNKIKDLVSKDTYLFFDKDGFPKIINAQQILQSRPSKMSVLEREKDQYYQLDDADKLFIATGIANNNIVKSFKLK